MTYERIFPTDRHGNPIGPAVEEVVRCRDCKHFTPKGTHRFGDGKTNEDYCTYVRGWMLQIAPDGYCAWGARADE